MAKRTTLPLHRALGASLLVALIALAALGWGARQAAGQGFTPIDSSVLEPTKLYDLGVADADADGHLDLFTTNHKFDSSLLLGDGRGRLRESRVALGLSPDQAFPGFEELRRQPDTSTPGLYLYATDRDEPRDPFHIDASGIAASGRIAFTARDLRIEDTSGASATASRLPDGTAVVDFDAQPGGTIDLTVEHIDLPIGVHVDAPADPSLIRVGADAIPAGSRDLVLNLRDRHGFGFGDFDGDREADLFVVTGGLGGDILDPFYTGHQSDELLLARPGGFARATAGSGLVKGPCRGRGVLVADFDGDGNLDLLETCELAAPHLYAGDGAGGFTRVEAPPAPASAYRAVDLVGDQRPELVAAAGDQLQVWRNVDGAWSLAQQIRTLNGARPVQHLATADLNEDGEPDLFAASPGGSTLLVAVKGRLHRRSLKKRGIPRRGTLAASFVDYDNDGRLDLDLIPQGLYEGRKGKFRRTGRLAYGPLPSGRLGYAITSWPDLDEDGLRDPISARGRGEFSTDKVIDVRRNTTGRSGHWLAVDLEGPTGDAEAIGARIKVRTAHGSSYGWVGQSDDSRHSSGHYRVYFGLGRARRIRKVAITWPDGRRQLVGPMRSDRRLRVTYRRHGQ